MDSFALNRGNSPANWLAWLLFAFTVAIPSLVFGGSFPLQEDDSNLDEQSIYIPYEELRNVFEKEGRGVFIPYDDFQKIWNAARKNQIKSRPQAAPLGALITDIESVATLGKEIVSVDATMRIELLKKGWHRIPLRLEKAAIRSATIDGSEAKIVTRDNNFELLLQHDDEKPKTVALKLSYAKSLSKSGAQRSVGFKAPQAPVNRWKIRTGASDVDVQIEPMIATSEQTVEEGDEQTKEILAFVGTAPEVRLTWTPKAEGAAGLAALVASNVRSQITIDSGVVRTTNAIDLDISRSEIRNVSVEVPADQKVVSVFDRNVKKWNVIEKDGLQRVEIELFEPAIGKQSLSLELEKFVERLDQSAVKVPQIKVLDSSRSSGSVLVETGEGLRVEPISKTGLMQMDQTEIAATSKGAWKLGFRYATLPYALEVNIREIQPQVVVNQLVEYSIQPDKVSSNLSALFEVKEAGVFQVQLEIPESFEIQDIRGINRNGLLQIPVDSFDRDPESPAIVNVTLAKKALGTFGIVATLQQNVENLNLDSPSDNPIKLPLLLPKAKREDIKFSSGNFVVYAPESLRINATTTKGLRKIGLNSVFRQHQQTLTGERPVLAYSFAHNEANIELEAKRRLPQINVEQLVVVGVETGAVKFVSRLLFDVRYSGVDSLRVDVPSKLVDQLRIRTEGIVQQTYEPQPEDVAENYVALKLTSESEFIGRKEIAFDWQRETNNLTLGQNLDIPVDRLIPQNVDRSTGKIVLRKSETIDVRPTREAPGLRPIDPQADLPANLRIADASMAFEYAGDWNLDLTATRFELQDLKQTSISRALVRAVVLRQNELSVQCLYNIRSVRQRLAIRMPTGFDSETSFDDQPIRINGNAVTPERGGEDTIFVPLIGLESDKPFVLELRYNLAGNAKEIEVPEFIEDPAAQKCFLAVYVPFEKALINARGYWTDEEIGDNHSALLQALDPNRSVWRHMFSRRSTTNRNYVQWVCESTTANADVADKFEVDGRPYVFSAIRPQSGPEGALRITTISVTLINVFVFGTILLIGLALFRSKLTIQIAFALFIVGGLLLAGILVPLLTEHLFGPAFVATSLVVGVAWLIGNLGRVKNQFFDALARRDDRQTELPPTPPSTDPPIDDDTPESPPAPNDSATSADVDESNDEGGAA